MKKHKVGDWRVVDNELGADIREARDGFLFGVQNSRLICQMAFCRTRQSIQEIREVAHGIVNRHNKQIDNQTRMLEEKGGEG